MAAGAAGGIEKDPADRGAARTDAATTAASTALEAGEQSLASAATGAAAPTFEGHLLKRRQRDSFGLWRCCGESWARRWFVLRGSVLYYYRAPGDSLPRGAMPMGQCRIELRPSPRGDYIKLSTRFSHRSLRIRADPAAGEGPQMTHTWMRALRAAAGLAPISGAPAFRPSIPLRRRRAARSAGRRRVGGRRRGGERRWERWAAHSAAARHLGGGGHVDGQRRALPVPALRLALSARPARLCPRARHGVGGALHAGCAGELRPAPHRRRGERAAASALVEELRPPPLSYVPLCPSSGKLAPVCRVLPDEGSVFLTRERASALVFIETAADEHGRKLSQLFEAVRSRGASRASSATLSAPRVRRLRSATSATAPSCRPRRRRGRPSRSKDRRRHRRRRRQRSSGRRRWRRVPRRRSQRLLRCCRATRWACLRARVPARRSPGGIAPPALRPP